MAKSEIAQQAASTTVHNADTYGTATETTFAKRELGVGERFQVSGGRLDGFIPTQPHERAKKSYIWQAGVGLVVTEVKSGLKFWLCRHCYDNLVPQPLFLVETDSTTPASGICRAVTTTTTRVVGTRHLGRNRSETQKTSEMR